MLPQAAGLGVQGLTGANSQGGHPPSQMQQYLPQGKLNTTISGSALNIQTPGKFAVIIQKFEQCDFNHKIMCSKDVDRMANSVYPDQTAPSV